MLSVGYLVNDSTSDLFWVELNDETGTSTVEHLGTILDNSGFPVEMDDIAFSPQHGLYAIDHAEFFPSRLFRIEIDFDSPSPTVTDTTLVGTIATSISGRVDVNSLEFGPDGMLYAAGFDFDFGNEQIYRIDFADAGASAVLDIPGLNSAGDLTFDEDNRLYLTTTSAELVEADVIGATTSFTVVGSTTFSDVFGLTYGAGPKMFGYRENHEVYHINRNTGQPTFVTTLEHPLLDFDFLNGATTLHRPPTVLGETAFEELVNQHTVEGERWYRFEAVRDGYVTADLPSELPGAGIDLTLYRLDTATDQLVELADGEQRVDFENGVAGQQYFLRIEDAPATVDVRIANLVTIVPDGANIFGTDALDTFEFAKGVNFEFAINGLPYQFGFGNVGDVNLTFEGGVGRDEAFLNGSENQDETVELSLSTLSGTMSGLNYTVAVSGTPEITVDGRGGTDEAVLQGTSFSDVLDAAPETATFIGGGALLVVTDIEEITVLAVSGAADTATLTGAAGRVDAYNARPGLGRLDGTGYSIRALDFDEYIADANGDPGDIARLGNEEPSERFAGDETLTGDSTSVTLTVGSGLTAVTHTVAGFPDVRAFAGSDGTDLADLDDSPGDDLFFGRMAQGTLTDAAQSVYSILAEGYDELTVTSTAGNDEAQLRGTDGNDVYTGTPTEGMLVGGGFTNRAVSFPTIHSFAVGGSGDTAVLRGLPEKDVFQGTWVYGRLAGGSGPTEFFHRAVRFETVDVYPTEEGVAPVDDDVANLIDGPLDDVFNGTPTLSQFRLDVTGPASERFTQNVHDFPVVKVWATEGGFDVANLSGFDPGDTLILAPDFTKLFNESYVIWLKTPFEEVNATPAPSAAVGLDGEGASGNDAALAALALIGDGESPSDSDEHDRRAAVDEILAAGELWMEP